MLKTYFPNREFRALLFDFDGTVADTMGAHLNAWNDALAIYNLTLSRDQHQAWAGRPTKAIVQLLNDLHGTEISPEEFTKAKELHYFSSMGNVQEIIPVVEIIKHYYGHLPMAIVSGSRHKPVETTLDHLGLAKYFATLVCAEDYVHGKPAPDCFLQAARLLKVEPADCLVFEDAPLGIESARNAGMQCLRISEDHRINHV